MSSHNNTALLLVDLQNDFFEGGSLAVPESRQIITIANAMINYCHLKKIPIIASKDWHPASHESFASNSNKKIGDTGILNGIQQTWWPIHCVMGSHGADFINELNQVYIEKVVLKGTNEKIDSYSVFFDNGQLSSTDLHEWLQQSGITHLWIMGLATDYCVKYSVIDALTLGYHVSLIIDGCKGVNIHPLDSQKAIEEMQQKGATIILSETLLAP